MLIYFFFFLLEISLSRRPMCPAKLLISPCHRVP